MPRVRTLAAPSSRARRERSWIVEHRETGSSVIAATRGRNFRCRLRSLAFGIRARSLARDCLLFVHRQLAIGSAEHHWRRDRRRGLRLRADGDRRQRWSGLRPGGGMRELPRRQLRRPADSAHRRRNRGSSSRRAPSSTRRTSRPIRRRGSASGPTRRSTRRSPRASTTRAPSCAPRWERTIRTCAPTR